MSLKLRPANFSDPIEESKMVKLRVMDDSSPLSQPSGPGAGDALGNFRGPRHHCVAADL